MNEEKDGEGGQGRGWGVSAVMRHEFIFVSYTDFRLSDSHGCRYDLASSQ